MALIYLKTPSQINKIEYVNKLGAEFLQICYNKIKPGLITLELEELSCKFCEKYGVKPSFYKYKGFPYRLCVSINTEVVHGFPREYKVKSGDIVSVDFGIEKDGYFSDAAFTKIVGIGSKKAVKLVKTTEECLYRGIERVSSGNRINDISRAIQNHATGENFDVIRQYMGHGVGLKLHEPPGILNYVSLGVNWRLKPGMVIAVEPMLVEGSYNVTTHSNGWTVFTNDGGLSAHFEHSIVVLDGGCKILSEWG